ncbi:MAG: GNAT family N-acetyltransferase, partial [Ilumatobacteraceae bacterium]
TTNEHDQSWTFAMTLSNFTVNLRNTDTLIAMASSVPVEIATQATEELLAACHHLIPQLSSSAKPMTNDELAEIIESDSTSMLVARVDNQIVGLLTLAVFRIPTAVRAWIEDVVVDSSARGHGVGEALNIAAIAEAKRRGAKTVDLTSRPSREAANRLYQRIGFVARDTNVYRFDT